MGIAFNGNMEAAKADSAYPVAPAGTYFLKVRNAQEKVSKTSGRNMIATEYVVAEGEYENKVHVFNYLTFIAAGEKGHGMTIHALKAHGLPYEGDVEISAADFMENGGILVKVDLDTETYQGREKNVIKKFYLPDEGQEAPAPAEAEDPNGTAQEEGPMAEDAPTPISPKMSTLSAAAANAGLVKPKTTVVKPAVKKPLPWAKKK